MIFLSIVSLELSDFALKQSYIKIPLRKASTRSHHSAV